MQSRSAKRIVSLCLKGTVNPQSYTRPQVTKAFRIMKIPMPDGIFQKWDDLTEQRRINHENQMTAARVNAQKKAERQARKEAQRRAREEALARVAADSKPQHDIAVEAARAVFQETIEKDRVPNNIALTDAPAVEAPEPTYEGLTLKELKVLAKENGIKGYSTLKKPELIKMLLGG